MFKEKKILNKILLISFITVFIFLLFDFLITSFNGYRGASKFYSADKYAGFINKPNFSGKFGGFLNEFSSNVNIGPLGERLSVIKDCQYSKNIIFLGDSGVAGFEVNDNETFVSKINLKQCKYKGINFGVRGYNTHNVLGNYKRIKERINHDFVVYIVFPNDLAENVNVHPGLNNLIKKFGNVFDEVYYPPQLSKSENIYYNLRILFADNFYLSTKLLYLLEKRQMPNFVKKKDQKLNKQISKISKEEKNKMNNLIKKLSEETASSGKILYVAGYPCLEYKKCKTIELENYLKKLSDKKSLFKVISLSNDLYEKFNKKLLDPSIMKFSNDPHLSKFGHSIVSDYLIKYFKKNG